MELLANLDFVLWTSTSSNEDIGPKYGDTEEMGYIVG